MSQDLARLLAKDQGCSKDGFLKSLGPKKYLELLGACASLDFHRGGGPGWPSNKWATILTQVISGPKIHQSRVRGDDCDDDVIGDWLMAYGFWFVCV